MQDIDKDPTDDSCITTKLYGTTKKDILQLINRAKTNPSIVNNRIPQSPNLEENDICYIINEKFPLIQLKNDCYGPWSSRKSAMHSRAHPVHIDDNGELVFSNKLLKESQMVLISLEYVLPRDKRLQKKIYKVCYVDDRTKPSVYPSVIRYIFKSDGGAPPLAFKKPIFPFQINQSKNRPVASAVEQKVKSCAQRSAYSRPLLIRNACQSNFSFYDETSIDGTLGSSIVTKNVIILYKSWALNYLAVNLPTEEEFVKCQEFFQVSYDNNIPIKEINHLMTKRFGLKSVLMFGWINNINNWNTGVLSMAKRGYSGNVEAEVPVAYVFSLTRLKSDVAVIRKWLAAALQERNPSLRVPSVLVDMEPAFSAFEDGDGCLRGARCIFSPTHFLKANEIYMQKTLKLKLEEARNIKKYLMTKFFDYNSGLVNVKSSINSSDIENLNPHIDEKLSRNIKDWLIQKLDILNNNLSARVRIISGIGLKKPSITIVEKINTLIKSALDNKIDTLHDVATQLGKFDKETWLKVYLMYTNGKTNPEKCEEQKLTNDGLRKLYDNVFFENVKTLIPDEFTRGKSKVEVNQLYQKLLSLRVNHSSKDHFEVNESSYTVNVRVQNTTLLCDLCKNVICCLHRIAVLLNHPEKLVLLKTIREKMRNEKKRLSSEGIDGSEAKKSRGIEEQEIVHSDNEDENSLQKGLKDKRTEPMEDESVDILTENHGKTVNDKPTEPTEDESVDILTENHGKTVNDKPTEPAEDESVDILTENHGKTVNDKPTEPMEDDSVEISHVDVTETLSNNGSEPVDVESLDIVSEGDAKTLNDKPTEPMEDEGVEILHEDVTGDEIIEINETSEKASNTSNNEEHRNGTKFQSVASTSRHEDITETLHDNPREPLDVESVEILHENDTEPCNDEIMEIHETTVKASNTSKNEEHLNGTKFQFVASTSNNDAQLLQPIAAEDIVQTQLTRTFEKSPNGEYVLSFKREIKQPLERVNCESCGFPILCNLSDTIVEKLILERLTNPESNEEQNKEQRFMHPVPACIQHRHRNTRKNWIYLSEEVLKATQIDTEINDLINLMMTS